MLVSALVHAGRLDRRAVAFVRVRAFRAFRVVFGFGSVAVGAPSPNSLPTPTPRGPIHPGLPVVFHPVQGFSIL